MLEVRLIYVRQLSAFSSTPNLSTLQNPGHSMKLLIQTRFLIILQFLFLSHHAP